MRFGHRAQTESFPREMLDGAQYPVRYLDIYMLVHILVEDNAGLSLFETHRSG